MRPEVQTFVAAGPLPHWDADEEEIDRRVNQLRPANCTVTCAGATPTPVTPTSWPLNAANAPASAVRKASAGAGAHSLPQHDYRAGGLGHSSV